MADRAADRSDTQEQLILVDEEDNPVGFAGKLEAHRNGGKLHRAFSIFIFNSEGKMLLQRRSLKKYHFGGFWTNACCSHPVKGEGLTDGVHRRLREEFGFDTELRERFRFLYRATDARSGLTEHELDHVFVGEFDGEPEANPDEIDDWMWVDLRDLESDLRANPEKYTPWFRMVVDRLIGERTCRPDPAPAP